MRCGEVLNLCIPQKKALEETPPRVTSVPNLSAYERSHLTSEAGTSMSPQTARSPSFEHGSRGLPLSRTNTPNSGSTLSPNPSPSQRQGRSPLQEYPHQHLNYTHMRWEQNAIHWKTLHNIITRDDCSHVQALIGNDCQIMGTCILNVFYSKLADMKLKMWM